MITPEEFSKLKEKENFQNDEDIKTNANNSQIYAYYKLMSHLMMMVACGAPLDDLMKACDMSRTRIEYLKQTAEEFKAINAPLKTE